MNDANDVNDVNPPDHYTFSDIEPLDVIEAWNLPHHLACVGKYIARAGRKASTTKRQDLEKAQYYLGRYLANSEELENQAQKASFLASLANRVHLEEGGEKTFWAGPTYGDLEAPRKVRLSPFADRDA